MTYTTLVKKMVSAAGLLVGSVLMVPAHAEEAAPAPAAAPPVELQTNKASSLDELLKLVQQRRVVEAREHTQREQQFRQEKDAQARLLAEAKSRRTREEQRSESLETRFEENEIRIGDLQEQLNNRLGSLRELFGVLQQVAGDTRGLFEGSMISAEYPNRGEWLGELAAKMGTASKLATIEEMEQLWFEIQREMTESGKISRFNATVNMLSGEKVEKEVVRVGAFSIVSGGEFLNYRAEVGALEELPKPPPARYTSTIDDLTEAPKGEVVAFAIDPTRGSLLSLLIQSATFEEQLGTPFGGISKGECYIPFCDGQGGSVGAVIILSGILGVILALERMFTLTMVGRKVNAQKKSTTPDEGNPLGRVLKVYDANKTVDVETLELKLSEAILGEIPKLTRNIPLIQVISVVAPLLGLLGTVVGMIITFQAITLFGTGDPKTMATGISVALVTTVEGLVVAIPTVLLHAIANQRSKSIIQTLEEQSAGLIAKQAEQAGRALG